LLHCLLPPSRRVNPPARQRAAHAGMCERGGPSGGSSYCYPTFFFAGLPAPARPLPPFSGIKCPVRQRAGDLAWPNLPRGGQRPHLLVAERARSSAHHKACGSPPRPRRSWGSVRHPTWHSATPAQDHARWRTGHNRCPLSRIAAQFTCPLPGIALKMHERGVTEGANCSAMQIGSTPSVSRLSSPLKHAGMRCPLPVRRVYTPRRWQRMKAIICETGGRASAAPPLGHVNMPFRAMGSGLPSNRERGLGQNTRSPSGLNQWRLHWLTLAQNPVGLTQFAVLALKLVRRRPSGLNRWRLDGQLLEPMAPSMAASPHSSAPDVRCHHAGPGRAENRSAVRRTTQFACDRHQREPLRVDIHPGVPSPTEPHARGTHLLVHFQCAVRQRVNTASKSASFVSVP
jgi:hypothetical protein